MRVIKIIVSAIIILGVVVTGFFMFYQGRTSNLTPTQDLSSDKLIERGKYLAKVGDCAACHTGDKGDYAGGFGLDSGTPVGLIYPSNITPDKKTGIGNYSLQDFDNAVRYGLRKNGDSLYPAMPYPSFAVVSSDDIEALYAYFMHGVPAIDNAVPGPTGDWPFTMNWPMNAWRIFFAPEVTTLVAAPDETDRLIRGAYLVEGLGHCGTCHTPRNDFMVEKAFKDDPAALYLSGGQTMEGWNAVNLRGDDMDGLGRVDVEQLAQLLQTGRNDHAAVFGSMVEVVDDSLQHLSADDAHAMAAYLKTLSAAKPNEPRWAYDEATHKALANGDLSVRGAMTYINNCAGCHRTDRKGYAQTCPALAGNSAILNDNADSLISIILRGHTMSQTAQAPTDYAMVGYAWRLDDQEVTDLGNFLRSSWGNQAKKIDPARVRALREEFITPEVLRYQQSASTSVAPFAEQDKPH